VSGHGDAPQSQPETDIGLWQEFLARFGLTLEQIDKNPPVYVIRGKKVGDGLGQGPVF